MNDIERNCIQLHSSENDKYKEIESIHITYRTVVYEVLSFNI